MLYLDLQNMNIISSSYSILLTTIKSYRKSSLVSFLEFFDTQCSDDDLLHAKTGGCTWFLGNGDLLHDDVSLGVHILSISVVSHGSNFLYLDLGGHGTGTTGDLLDDGGGRSGHKSLGLLCKAIKEDSVSPLLSFQEVIVPLSLFPLEMHLQDEVVDTLQDEGSDECAKDVEELGT